MDDTPIDLTPIRNAATEVTTDIIQKLSLQVVTAHRNQPCYRSRAILNQELRDRLTAALDMVLLPPELTDASALYSLLSSRP